MDLKKLDGIQVFIIESLKAGDLKTGTNLKDDLRQYWYDEQEESCECIFEAITNEKEFIDAFKKIENQVKNKNKFPIIQLECHGSVEGIKLNSEKKIITWSKLFDYLRPINVLSYNLLLLNLSLCHADAVIRYIDPTKRAPFRAVSGPTGEIEGQYLENSWQYFYRHLFSSLQSGERLCNLILKSGLIYYSQEYIFDAHFNLMKLHPDIFESNCNRDIANLYQSEGILAMDPQLYKKWIADRMNETSIKYKKYFCFQDLAELHEEAYKELKK